MQWPFIMVTLVLVLVQSTLEMLIALEVKGNSLTAPVPMLPATLATQWMLE